jgi:hypothetical protein
VFRADKKLTKAKKDRQLTWQGGFEILLCWLIPGSGFLLKKAYVRGIVIFGIIMSTFAIGVALSGSVIWPVWHPKAEGFNIVSCLTFIVQLGNGLPSFISVASTQGLSIGFLQSKEWHAYFDLASFYILISGAMNYFIVMNFYDRYYNKKYHSAAEGKK